MITATNIQGTIEKIVMDTQRWGQMQNAKEWATELLAIVTFIYENELLKDSDTPTKEELTRVRRQLTACQAREAKLKKAGDSQ